MEIEKLTKNELREFIIENAKTIAGMRDLMDGARRLLETFQNGQLTAKFHEDVKLHQFTFSITDQLIAANPDLTEMATVIATQVHNYIKAHKERSKENRPDPTMN